MITKKDLAKLDRQELRQVNEWINEILAKRDNAVSSEQVEPEKAQEGQVQDSLDG